jgi:DNA-binding CsgD family transcriptional regulator
MRRLSDNGLVGSQLGAKNGLSRRETKVLMMITEGGSSKLIAKSLGVTEATVKYHLSNIYRKLGCKRRREAINAARALGLVS